MAAPVQIISETRSPRYMIQLRGSDMGDNCLQGRREYRPREGPVAVDYVRSKPTRSAVGVDGENLRDPVGKQLGRAREVPCLAWE